MSASWPVAGDGLRMGSGEPASLLTDGKEVGVPGVISGKFAVRKIATTSPSVAGHVYSPKKQDVVLYVTSYAERDVSVLGSKTCRVTPVYRPS
jgi:hypothetical protein